jgi:hypothetical protein
MSRLSEITGELLRSTYCRLSSGLMSSTTAESLAGTCNALPSEPPESQAVEQNTNRGLNVASA